MAAMQSYASNRVTAGMSQAQNILQSSTKMDESCAYWEIRFLELPDTSHAYEIDKANK